MRFYEESIIKNINRNTNIKTSKLCAFESLDYIVVASTLALAFGEELSLSDINVLATFFAILSDELALIAALEACNSNDETTAPTPSVDVALTRNKANKKIHKKLIKRKLLKKNKMKKSLNKFSNLIKLFLYIKLLYLY